MMEERIKQVMESLHLSQQDFAQKLKISPASLSNIFNGRSKPTMNHVQAIHAAFPEINTNWLAFGEGTMLSGSGNSAPGSPSQNPSLFPEEVPSGSENPVSQNSQDSNDGPGLFSSYPGPAPRDEEQSSKIKNRPVEKPIIQTKIVRTKVVEIRVFYDDQTYESFLPSEKRNVSR